MSFSRTVLPAATALILVATACTDDMVAPNDELTQDEATDLLVGFRALLVQTDPGIIAESEDGVVIKCPLGGLVEFIGNVDEEFVGDTARLSLDVNANPSGCGVAGDDAEYTLTGDPGIRERITVEIVGSFESFDISGSTAGAVAWESDDRSGTCDVDLVLSAQPDLTDPNAPAVVGTLSGMLCGHEVEIDVEELPIE